VTGNLEVTLDIYESRYAQDGVLVSTCYRPLESLQSTGWWASSTPIHNKHKKPSCVISGPFNLSNLCWRPYITALKLTWTFLKVMNYRFLTT